MFPLSQTLFGFVFVPWKLSSSRLYLATNLKFPWFAPLHVSLHGWDFMSLVSCLEQGLKTERVVCTESQFLEYFSFPKQGQDFQLSVAPLYPNSGQVPSEGCRMLFMIILMLLPLCCFHNEVDNIIQFLFLLCLVFTPIQIFFPKLILSCYFSQWRWKKDQKASQCS